LGIVVINKRPDPLSSKVCPVQKEGHILVPYNEGKLVMNIEGPDMNRDTLRVTRESLIHEFEDVFQPRLMPMPGENFKISLEFDTKSCKVRYAQHVPMAYKAKLKAGLDELVKNGIISPVSKPTDWCNPIGVTSKKNSDKIRLCVDFRQLNRSVARELYPTKSVLEACQSIERDEAKVFFEFDAVKGYHQIALDEESKDLTTFITPFGRYRYERAPFGICSISEHFERKMDESLENLSNIVKVVDNNCIYSKDFESHVSRARAFLQRCREKKIHLSQEKFAFAQREIEFAGAILSDEGYKMQPKIYEAIEKFPFPTNLTEMRAFYGVANQLTPFNENLSKALSPLRPLLKKDAEFFVDDERKLAFENAKRIMGSDQMLAYHCQGRLLRLFTDASNINGLGCELQQCKLMAHGDLSK